MRRSKRTNNFIHWIGIELILIIGLLSFTNLVDGLVPRLDGAKIINALELLDLMVFIFFVIMVTSSLHKLTRQGDKKKIRCIALGTYVPEYETEDYY